MKILCRFFCIILFVSGFIVSSFAQEQGLYPEKTENLIELVNHLLKTNFSTNEAVKRLGTLRTKTEETEDETFEEMEEYGVTFLTPFPTNGSNIKKLMLTPDDDPEKLGSIDFSFKQPVKISYGTMQKKYGKPKNLPSPIVNCGDIPNCNRNLFVGYSFNLPAKVSGKKVDLIIILFMKASGEPPKHKSDRILEVEDIRISWFDWE